MKNFCIIQTDLGYIAITGENGLLTGTTLPLFSQSDAFAAIKGGINASFIEDNAGFGKLPDMMRSYAQGEYVDFSNVPVDLSVFGDFHKAALLSCQQIPYGQVVTYGALACESGSARAARAVGSAMAGNKTPIVIPCHRVISSGGKIGGFSSGLEWKRTLLKLEGLDI